MELTDRRTRRGRAQPAAQEGTLDNIERAIHAMDWVNRTVGRVAAWLTLATVLICGTVFVLRSSAGLGYIWLQELY
jgi:TRAP-type mannitol/chloroaromatic compound transport system permease small subunit